MAFLSFNNVGINGVSACVPKNIRKNKDLEDLLGKDELNKVIKSIGIQEMRHVDKCVTPSDLCYEAALTLIEDLKIDKSDIDLILFLSQNGDFKIPATSPSLQHRLGLPKTTACIDLTLACSGYVYALSAAYSYASQPTINKVLLLVGEVFSQIVSDKDKVNAPLYGDAGTATLISKGDFGESQFNLYSDGSGFEAVQIPAGGARCPSTSETVKSREMEKGNSRTLHQLYMDGLDVFNFTLKVVPSSIKEALSKSNNNNETIDYFLFHQANKFMIDFFRKKLKIAEDKVPISLDKFGNVSSATIPLTIVTKLKDKIVNKKLLLSGFGAGLSWATAVLDTSLCKVSKLKEI
jgi:3-oxoacyl-[acyl-carrier-protein] synthase III